MSDDPAIDDGKRLGSSEIVKNHYADAEANRAIRSAQIAPEQAWPCNARRGCAVVAVMGLRTVALSRVRLVVRWRWSVGGGGAVA